MADQAGIGVAPVRRYEGGNPIADISLAALSGALASAGVTLIGTDQKSTSGGVGVRLAKPETACLTVAITRAESQVI